MASKPSAHTPENTILAGGVRLPAGSEVIRDRKRVRLDAGAKAWQFTIRSSRLARGVPDHTLLVAEDGEWAVCSCGACVNRDRCTLVDNPAAILRHHGLLPPADPGGAARARLAPIEGYDDRAAAALDAAQSDPGGAVGEPPEPAGLTECEDAARDERKRRYTESMANLYGNPS